MVEILRDLFLSPLLVFVVLVFIFLALSYWSVAILQEYTGYVLGWLIGLFVVVVFASLGATPDVQAQDVELELATLNIFQVICAAAMGIIVGISAMALRLITAPSGMPTIPRGVQVAIIIGLFVTLMFLMFMVGIEAQRMIGIFALAFCIARLFSVVLMGRQPGAVFGVAQVGGIVDPQSVADPLADPLSGTGNAAQNFNALDAKRGIFNRPRR